ncbi:MAG: type VII secretion target [Rhodococcus fascians]
MLQVDPDSLRALSSSLTRTADAVASLDPSPPLRVGVEAMPHSAFGAVAGNSAETVLAAYRTAAERIRQIADAAGSSATSYDRTEAAFREQLHKFLGEQA